MDLAAYRQDPQERARTASLLELTPKTGESLLDVGSRDGFLCAQMKSRFKSITALDLEEPSIADPDIETVAGDVTRLQFGDGSFDVVLCAEVLEHVPTDKLSHACSELARVSRRTLVIGVPCQEDTRTLKTTCAACGKTNPPYGHVNTFDENKLKVLFRDMKVAATRYVETDPFITNRFSSALMTFAGNPAGSYEQEEPCVHCGAKLVVPANRQLLKKVVGRIAHTLTLIQRRLTPPKEKWIHMVLERN